MGHPRIVAFSTLAILIALYVVGAVSVPPGSLRHEVQTLPLWFPIVAGFRGRASAKWAALPCLVFWLTTMIVIWLFLAGWARLITGHFSQPEIAMTIVIGAAGAAGIIAALRWRTQTPAPMALSLAVAFGALQLIAFRVSMLPYVATR